MSQEFPETPFGDGPEARKLEAQREARRQRWIKSNSAEPRRRRACLASLLFSPQKVYRMIINGDDVNFGVRGVEHCRFWKTSSGSVLTFQPYKTRFDDNREALKTACAEQNLECRISARDSWHYPGDTVLVEVWKAGTK